MSIPTVLILTTENAHAANPATKTVWHYYDISGNAARELKAQMKEKGPQGYWAYARWWINWSANCEVSLEINYTMPRWINKADATEELQSKWASMIDALAKHEKGHGEHGIKAANAIVQSNCDAPHRIIKKWANQDKVFDKETGHGRLRGVVLPQ